MHEITAARFGEEVADYLVSSFCRGVFAADSKQLSMKAAFPLMWKRLKPKEVHYATSVLDNCDKCFKIKLLVVYLLLFLR